MRNKIVSLIIAILVASSINCISQTNDSVNYVKFKIDAPPIMRPKATRFEVGDYNLPVKNVFVMRGSNTGIKIEFMEKVNDTSTLYLEIELPSGDTFKVYAKNKGFEYKTPEIPCTITNEDFKGIKSARAQSDLYAYIYLIKENRIATDELKKEGVTFENFSINIRAFSIKDGKISFSGTFSGELSEMQEQLQDVNYKISGEFNIADLELGIMMVDD